MHRLGLNQRVDWNTVSPSNIRVTGIFTARAGSPIGLEHQNHKNSKITKWTRHGTEGFLDRYEAEGALSWE